MSSETDMPNNRDYADSFSTSDDDLPTTNRKFSNMSSMSDVDDLPTTLMIRNIPNQYAQKDFIQELDSLGFKGTYNFLYIPVDKKSAASCGYGFINFIDHHWAAKCASVFQDYLLTPKKGKGKYAEVSAAHLQGLEANIAHYRNTKILGGCGRKSGRVCAPLIIESLA
jgi:RNA recognition motif-containing protein